MGYNPKHQPQLTGIATQSVDCGVRSTQMAIDWATRGNKVPGVKNIRSKMDKPTGPTNAWLWEKAIRSYTNLGAGYEPPIPTKLVVGDWAQVVDHNNKGLAAIIAVDYGVLRREAPNQTGSESFNGYHAILLKGRRKLANGVIQRRSWDPLNDGRYRGCPKGPVFIANSKLKKAAEQVGRDVIGKAAVYALLVWPAPTVGGIGDPGPEPEEPEEPATLADVMVDLIDYRDDLTDPDRVDRVQTIIDDLAAAIGIPDLDEILVPEEGVDREEPVQ